MKQTSTLGNLPNPSAAHQRDSLPNTTGATREPLLNEQQAAEFLNIRPGTLACWRVTKRYPLPYVKIGRSVRYRRSDLEAFAAAREQGADELAQGGEQ